ncbi:hypothetical protein VOLCADRAFT_103166 [Volvox carteri f. nagariensis]|uniref:DUF1995 domain-containing protein n=1 Tax=Volvox carteri f. nagariensis TaxID=3068 RepID=D8TJX1_VOLCA|nr:uncharacterized protein VOLCADRAFT_103166 [Volvox carteri f. nagariensis]EFJ52145.1 hypothetical protein VOLCADRAFT_103166 [Volvox carteri f. nagariensis]|eukprot:XP_002946919.1 hypothetical protein VOLCADRAFT_103166 [Volvox carteri f. nagariensis]
MSHHQSLAAGHARVLANSSLTCSRFVRGRRVCHQTQPTSLRCRHQLDRFALLASANEPITSASNGAVLDKRSGRMTYKPLSYGEMVNDAVDSVVSAIGDNLKWLEVEFPALPTNVDGYKGSSDLFIDSNTQLALAGARRLAARGRKVHIVLPDGGEYARTCRIFKNSIQLAEGVTVGHLKEGSPPNPLSALFGGGAPSSKEAGEQADTYIFINATCIELLNVRAYVDKMVADGGQDKVFILWNMELDTLRGDLGLPAFPSKDMHYQFLSRVRPVFYLRPRDYSKSVPVPPFIVNYSGALFREYPGPWQVMLKQDGGEYACIAEDRARYNLGEVKEELTVAMGLATEAEGSAMQFLRRGYKTSTWYEDDYDLEQSHEWRL